MPGFAVCERANRSRQRFNHLSSAPVCKLTASAQIEAVNAEKRKPGI
jgi:hypothetical protein